jgi:hypothetical protein
MGNSGTKDKEIDARAAAYGQIYLELGQTNYLSGDTVIGTVHLNLIAPFPGNRLIFKIKGTESARWIEWIAMTRDLGGGMVQHYSYPIEIVGEADIIDQNIRVYNWLQSDTIFSGQYSFPFSFKLPSGLPGSFFMQNTQAVAEINYSMSAYLEPINEKNYPRLEYKSYVTIREPVQPNIQQKELSIDRELQIFCCCRQGKINLKATIDRDAYAPLDTMKILVEVDNAKGKLNAKSISCSLVQTINYTNGTNHGHSKYQIQASTLGTLKAGQAWTGNDRKELVFQLPPLLKGESKEMKNIGTKQYNPREAISASAHGKIITSDYSLQVQCEMSGCTCNYPSPVSNLIFQVYATQQEFPHPTPPNNWQPQEMPISNFAVKGAYEIQQPGFNNYAVAPNNNTSMTNNQMPQPQDYYGVQQNPHYQQVGNPQYIQNATGSYTIYTINIQ